MDADNKVVPSPGGVLFFACPKKRTKRNGSHAALTTPVDALRNRRGENSLRSNSSPLFPVAEPAARQGGNGSLPAQNSSKNHDRYQRLNVETVVIRSLHFFVIAERNAAIQPYISFSWFASLRSQRRKQRGPQERPRFRSHAGAWELSQRTIRKEYHFRLPERDVTARPNIERTQRKRMKVV